MTRRLIFLAALTLAAHAELPPAAPLGSQTFQASAATPVGWRGDGTGRYPGATPPTTWSRTATAAGYDATGIVWAAPLPAAGVSSPIVVGDRVFLTSEISDLVCLDKATGRVLWIRSNSEFEGLSEDVRKAEPAYAEKLAPLAAELEKANAQVVEALNARLRTAAGESPVQKVTAPFVLKKDIETRINKEQLAIDKKLFNRYWGQAVFGFAGQTPTSDGRNVCAFFTTGVTACYDLAGNRKWIARGGGNGSEHGNFASPILCDGRLIVWANEMRAYDVDTGKLTWSSPAKAYNTYGSCFRLRSGGELVACFQWGFFNRVRDGQPVWEQGVFGDCVDTPIVEGDTIYASTGYPKYNDKVKGLKAFKIPADTGAGKIKPAYDFKRDWADDELPVADKKNPFDRGFVASPLYVDGLIYQVTQGGGLLVNEAATGALVYKKVLPLNPRTHYWDWAGASASPTLAGKYIYLMDNQGTTLVIEPGRQYKEVGRNSVQESKDGKAQAQNLATPVFEGSRMYYRSPGYLYCIGEK